jgi:hypothetical protein
MHGFAQGLEIPGKFLLEDRQEVVQELAVITYARKQLSKIEGQIRRVFLQFLHYKFLLMASHLRLAVNLCTKVTAVACVSSEFQRADRGPTYPG